MNQPTGPSSPAADEQASLWAARLEGSTLSAADRTALDTWLDENPLHRALLSRYCQFSADLEVQLPALVAAGTVTLPANEPPARATRGFRWLGPVALGAAAAGVIALWLARPGAPLENVATPAGQRQSITLADGTRVELNARTSLQVANTRTERRVRLAGGEAFFQVHKDPSRPFFVETPSGSVRVTGTTFDVRAETPAELAVTVVEGSVLVRPGIEGGDHAADPVALKAGDSLIAGAKGTAVRALSADDLADALAWRQGRIVFHRTPLSEALAQFAHFHGRGISVGPGVGELTLGGSHNLDDLGGFLAELEKFMPVTVTRDPGGNFTVSLRRAP
jgi:transmembrane sensor